MRATMRMLAASTLIALAPFAGAAGTATGSGTLDTQVKVLDNTGASRGQALVASRIASGFTNLAGSQANSLALVNGLRTGAPVTLTSTTTTGTGATATTTTTTSTLTPPTKPMGWGNVKIALALAQAQLQQAGITNPTASQLQAALNGGSITKADGTTVALRGVLTMRASGMGWGQIAQAGGTKLGPVVSSLKQTQAKVAALPVSRNSGSTTTATNTTAKSGAATTTTAHGKSGGVTTAHGKSSGITTAGGAGASSLGGGNSAKGLATAGGTAAGTSSHGLVTAGGATVSHGPGAMGGSHGSGAGIVSGAGAGAGSGAGVTTANGNSGGTHGNAGGNGKGKGG